MIKVLTILPSLSMGGAENMAYELIKNLDQTKYEPTVICYGPKRGTVLERKMERVCDVVYLNIDESITPIHVFSVMRKISSFHPDIIHSHMGGVTFAIPWCRFHHKPLVITVHTRPNKAFSSRNQTQIRSFIKSGLLKIVAVSQENYKLLADFYSINDDRLRYINNGIDVDRFYRKEHELFTFINVARQDDNKNQAAIIRTFKRIHENNENTRLYLIGDGPCHDDLISLAQELGLSDCVYIPGQVECPEEYYAISDVYVQSSHREAMPLSVLEALAAGLIIVSTDVGGLRDVVKSNGILVPDNDENKLYDALNDIISLETESITRLNGTSREISSDYSSLKMAKAYSAIYEEMVD